MSKKKMTVEMKQPFVWPESPNDMAPYVLSFSPVPCYGCVNWLDDST